MMRPFFKMSVQRNPSRQQAGMQNFQFPACFVAQDRKHIWERPLQVSFHQFNYCFGLDPDSDWTYE